MSFSIVTDTSANLPREMAEQKRVTVLPYYYEVDGRHCSGGLDAFNGAAFYDAMRKGASVTTSLISPNRHAEGFRPLLEAGQDILFISMSSGISGSFQAATIAAEELKEEFPQRVIRLLDTLGASLGEGLLVLKAAELRDRGQSLDEVFGVLLVLRRRICQVFTVDDLQYLRKGGRLSGTAAAVGTVLNLKPLLIGDEEGRIVCAGTVRGRKRAVEALAARYEALAEHPEAQTVGIAQAGCPADAAILERLLRKNRPPKEILTVCYEPVTGSHVGPGALALFFEGGRNARQK